MTSATRHHTQIQEMIKKRQIRTVITTRKGEVILCFSQGRRDVWCGADRGPPFPSSVHHRGTSAGGGALLIKPPLMHSLGLGSRQVIIAHRPSSSLVYTISIASSRMTSQPFLPLYDGDFCAMVSDADRGGWRSSADSWDKRRTYIYSDRRAGAKGVLRFRYTWNLMFCTFFAVLGTYWVAWIMV